MPMQTVVFTNDGADVTVNFDPDAVPNHLYASHFVRRNFHEVLFRRVSAYLLEHGRIEGSIVDAGAWIGDNAVPWGVKLKTMNSSAKIYAIDPSPDNCQFIKAQLPLNGLTNVEVIEAALSDKEETLRTSSDLRHAYFDGTGHTSAAATTLDALMRAGVFTERVGYVHLDVEFMEARVFRGAVELLQHWQPIVSYEQHLEREPVAQLVAWLLERGYISYMINEVLPGCFPDCRNLLALPAAYAEALADELNKAFAGAGHNGGPLLIKQ